MCPARSIHETPETDINEAALFHDLESSGLGVIDEIERALNHPRLGDDIKILAVAHPSTRPSAPTRHWNLTWCVAAACCAVSLTVMFPPPPGHGEVGDWALTWYRITDDPAP